jgi:hypothetical protein
MLPENSAFQHLSSQHRFLDTEFVDSVRPNKAPFIEEDWHRARDWSNV